LFRFILPLMFVCGFSSFALAQDASEGPVEPNPLVKLTWEQVDAPDRVFPFDDEVNACIEQDRYNNRGFGEPCIWVPNKYCPDPNVDRPGTHAARSCYSYVRAFWDRRLDEAYADIFAHYVETDREKPAEKQRAPMLDSLQEKWIDWRDAKCGFIPKQTSFYSPWVNIEAVGCVNDMTAIRVLELEDLRRLLGY